MGAVFTDMLNAGSIVGAMNVVNDAIASFAQTINIPAIAVFIVGAVAAILVGLFGYKYVKLVTMVCYGVIGYAIGEQFFFILKENEGKNLGEFWKYVFGIVVMALLGYLAYKMFAYAMFGMAGLVGFIICYFFYPNYFVAIVCAVIVAMIAMCYVRYAFIGLFSIWAGAATMSMVSEMFPDVRLLSLSKGIVGSILAFVLMVIFLMVQLYTSAGQTKTGILGGGKILGKSGSKRVKIRRVFDAW